MAHAGRPGKNARFYCEQCGAEVRAGAATCPSCGSRFTAIRCPKCGYEGRAPEFQDGCPVCGYGMGLPDHAARPAAASTALRRHRGIPRIFSRLVVAVLALLIVVLLVVLLVHG